MYWFLYCSELPGGFEGKQLNGKLPDAWSQISRQAQM
jgi:hypothetical protein